MSILRTTVRDAHHAIADRRNFTAASMSGELTDWPMVGYLSDSHRAQLHKDRAANNGHVYVVLSYSTPIAWWTPATGWRVPNARYSVTTGRHQGKVAMVTGTRPNRTTGLWA